MKKRVVSLRDGKRKPRLREPNSSPEALGIEQVRLIGDLRIMHARVDELFHVVSSLRERFGEAEIVSYADRAVLGGDIDRVDEIYLWFVKLKAASDQKA